LQESQNDSISLVSNVTNCLSTSAGFFGFVLAVRIDVDESTSLLRLINDVLAVSHYASPEQHHTGDLL